MKSIGSLVVIALLIIPVLVPASAPAAESRVRLLQSRNYIHGFSGPYSDRRGFTWAEVQAIRMLERMP